MRGVIPCLPNKNGSVLNPLSTDLQTVFKGIKSATNLWDERPHWGIIGLANDEKKW